MDINGALRSPRTDTASKAMGITSNGKVANKRFEYSNHYSALPAASDPISNIATQQASQLNNGQHVANKDTPVFIAITGKFEGDGSDVTHKVAGKSATEEIFMTTRNQLHQTGTGLDGLFIAPGLTCGSTVDTVRRFVAQNRQPDEKLVIYGYSNGGRCALDAATALQQDKQEVDLLVTVDATDRMPYPATNMSVANNIPDNVAVHHNYYQQKECGWLTCPQGGEHSAESPTATRVFNHRIYAEQVENPEYKLNIHRHMEDINKQSILTILDSALQSGEGK